MGSDRDCSTAFATYPAVPCWKSRLEAPLSKGAPSISMRRAQARAVALWSSLHFASVADLVYRPLCCLAPFWGSTSWGGRFFPTAATLFPFSSLFLLWSAGSAWRVGTGGGGGSFVWASFSWASHPDWDSNNSCRLDLCSRWILLSSGMGVDPRW